MTSTQLTMRKTLLGLEEGGMDSVEHSFVLHLKRWTNKPIDPYSAAWLDKLYRTHILKEAVSRGTSRLAEPGTGRAAALTPLDLKPFLKGKAT